MFTAPCAPITAICAVGQAKFRSARFVGRTRQVPTICNLAAPEAVWASQISGPLTVRSPQARTDQAVVENQWPGIRPCGLVRVPAGSCGKIRTPAGSRWGGTLRQTYVNSAPE